MPTSTSSVQALENVGAFCRWGIVTNTRVAALVFGFAHGFGMSSKLRALSLSPNGLIGNMIAYNIGVELGQIFAFTFILLALQVWRRTASPQRGAYAANVLIMTAGFAAQVR